MSLSNNVAKRQMSDVNSECLLLVVLQWFKTIFYYNPMLYLIKYYAFFTVPEYFATSR